MPASGIAIDSFINDGTYTIDGRTFSTKKTKGAQKDNINIIMPAGAAAAAAAGAGTRAKAARKAPTSAGAAAAASNIDRGDGVTEETTKNNGITTTIIARNGKVIATITSGAGGSISMDTHSFKPLASMSRPITLKMGVTVGPGGLQYKGMTIVGGGGTVFIGGGAMGGGTIHCGRGGSVTIGGRGGGRSISTTSAAAPTFMPPVQSFGGAGAGGGEPSTKKPRLAAQSQAIDCHGDLLSGICTGNVYGNCHGNYTT